MFEPNDQVHSIVANLFVAILVRNRMRGNCCQGSLKHKALDRDRTPAYSLDRQCADRDSGNAARDLPPYAGSRNSIPVAAFNNWRRLSSK
jgi:hypothetical protein